MTLATLNYGPMRRPDEEKKPETSVDVVQQVMAAYAAWLPIGQRAPSPMESDRKPAIEQYEQAYEEAVALMTKSGNAISNATQNELEQIAAAINAKSVPASGIFTTAAFNLSPVMTIEGTFEADVLGYRLAAGKTMILSKDSVVWDFGSMAEGNTLNYGRVYGNMASQALGGKHVNFSTARELGLEARNSVLLNFDSVDDLTSMSEACLGVNFGAATLFFHHFMGSGARLNLGTADARLNNIAFGDTCDNLLALRAFGAGINYCFRLDNLDASGEKLFGISRSENLSRVHAIEKITAEVSGIVAPIKGFAGFKDRGNLPKAVLRYDWESARKRLLGRAAELYRTVGGSR